MYLYIFWGLTPVGLFPPMSQIGLLPFWLKEWICFSFPPSQYPDANADGWGAGAPTPIATGLLGISRLTCCVRSIALFPDPLVGP